MAKIGIAGNAGDRIRSDCLVQVERVSSGGITINLDSKVEKLYGRSIRELAIRMLEHFGLVHARVEIQDSGALEFVLAARLEAALKQVIDSDRSYLLDSKVQRSARGRRDRYRFTRGCTNDMYSA